MRTILFATASLLLTACASTPQKDVAPLGPIDIYLISTAEQLEVRATAAIAANDNGKVKMNDNEVADDERPKYDAAIAEADSNGVLASILSVHYTKFRQCMTLGSTTVAALHECGAELSEAKNSVRKQLAATPPLHKTA